VARKKKGPSSRTPKRRHFKKQTGGKKKKRCLSEGRGKASGLVNGKKGEKDEKVAAFYPSSRENSSRGRPQVRKKKTSPSFDERGEEEGQVDGRPNDCRKGVKGEARTLTSGVGKAGHGKVSMQGAPPLLERKGKSIHVSCGKEKNHSKERVGTAEKG